jgi:hypothetical protein
VSWIARNIDWILIVSGAATFSMIAMALAPHFAMRFLFGAMAEGRVANLIARSWGAMIAASGLMLIYAAWHPEARLPILLYSIAGKAGFIALVLAAPELRSRNAVMTAAADLLIVMLLVWHLAAAR